VLAKRLFARDRHITARLKKIGSGLEFADHRPYSPGDDFRAIDWNVASRLGKLIVRLFEEDEDLSVYFLLDESASMAHHGKFDHARRVLAALAYLALANIDRVTVHAFASALGGTLSPRSGRAQVFAVMKFLEQRKAGGGTGLLRASREFAARTKRRGLVVLVTDFFSTGEYKEAVKFLRFSRFDVFGLHVFAPDDEAPAVSGELALRDVESKETIAASVGKETLEAYRRAFAEFQGEIEKTFVKHGALLLPAPVRIPFEDLVLAALREGLFVKK
jgi:uncharacterized protein (DUF58 family)